MDYNKYNRINTENISNLEKLNNKYNLKNLMELTNDTPINIFNKKKNNITLKNTDTIIKECNKIKKKEVNEAKYMLSNLSKLNTGYDDIRKHYNNIVKVDKIIEYLTLDLGSDTESDTNSDNYMEIFEN